jgi:hypothetical protein
MTRVVTSAPPVSAPVAAIELAVLGAGLLLLILVNLALLRPVFRPARARRSPCRRPSAGGSPRRR